MLSRDMSKVFEFEYKLSAVWLLQSPGSDRHRDKLSIEFGFILSAVWLLQASDSNGYGEDL